MSQTVYKIAKRNYDAGLWNRSMVENLVNLGRLTQDEYDDIVGDDKCNTPSTTTQTTLRQSSLKDTELTRKMSSVISTAILSSLKKK